MSDYYTILGITKEASPEEIKKAYRKLAHQYHPDKDGGDEEKFKKINEAYQVLGNEQKRAQYDRFGQTFEGGGAGGPFGFGGFSGFGQNINMEDLGGFGDIFETFFGGAHGNSRTRTRRGDDIAIDVTISFRESAVGLERELTHRLYQTCNHCHGNGAEPGTPIVDCPTCAGAGTVNHTRQTPFGIFTQRTVCPECQGEGKQVKTRCLVCRGEGRQLTERTLAVDIPAGIGDGQTIRLRGKGEVPRRGGAAGDLYVTVHVAPDPRFTRDGIDVRSHAAISFAEAALGIEITVPTLTGEETLKVPPGTQPGMEFSLSGKGFPQVGGSSRGDQIVTVDVEIPKRLSRQQRQLLEEFKKSKKKKFLF